MNTGFEGLLYCCFERFPDQLRGEHECSILYVEVLAGNLPPVFKQWDIYLIEAKASITLEISSSELEPH